METNENDVIGAIESPVPKDEDKRKPIVNNLEAQMKLIKIAVDHFHTPLRIDSYSSLFIIHVPLSEYVERSFWVEHDMKECYVDINGKDVNIMLSSPIHPPDDLHCSRCGKSTRTRYDGICKKCHLEVIAWRD